MIPFLLILFLGNYHSLAQQIKSDKTGVPTARSSLNMSAIPIAWPRNKIFETLAQQAQENQVNIYLPRRTGAFTRSIYVFPGAPDRILGGLTSEHYNGNFIPEYNTELKAWQKAKDINLAPSGTYQIDGRPEQGRIISKALADLGLQNSYKEIPAAFEISEIKSFPPVDTGLLALSFLAIASGALYRAIRRWPIVALRISGGRPFWRAWAREYWATLITVVATLAAFIALSSLALYAYNGGLRLLAVLLPVGLVGLTGIAVILIVQTLALMPTFWSKLAPMLKGKQPRILLASMVALVQLAGFFSITGFITQSIVMNSQKESVQALEALAKSYEGLYQLRSENEITAESASSANNFLRAAQQKGILIMSARDGYPPTPGSTYHRDLHVVNNAYLKHFPVFKTDGTRFFGKQNSTENILVGIPSGFSAKSAELIARRLENSSHKKVNIIDLQPQQPFLGALFSAEADMPIVVSSLEDYLTGDQSANGSTYGFYFQNYDLMRQVLHSSGYDKYAPRVTPASTPSPNSEPFISRDQAWIIFSLLAATIATLIATAIYSEHNRRRIFVQAIFGKSFWHRHRWYLLPISTYATLATLYIMISYLINYKTYYERDVLLWPSLALSLGIMTAIAGLSYVYLWLRGRKLLLEDLKNS